LPRRRRRHWPKPVSASFAVARSRVRSVTFFNQYCIFVMLAPRALVRSGRRVQVEVG
jgi:hypothetical protein